ncbi:hypothetical protein MLD38_014254 [Melastoma candidum]|uniref:Uncharacterized protein n=1 Tax=Melastoma candidum TaxID=119954 RepID=A0ACB9RCA1_9MYRT|nr:hypothetical protein MLD38_014254 [Melastoma candidum]
MANEEDAGSPGWSASFFMQTTEDIARAVAAAAAAATAAHSPRPSVVFSARDDSGSQLQKLRRHVSSMLKGFSAPSEVKYSNYNPEVLTIQKRQWANFQLQYLDHRAIKEASRLFESMVVVGLHPNCNMQALHKRYAATKSENPGKLQSSLTGQHQSHVEPNLEPQILFVYPPEKPLPLKYKDLLSFCFPGGVEVNAVERTPSMSELNEILLGQEHLKQSDLSFVFRLQVADDSTLYGCCVLVDELIQRPSGLISMISDKQFAPPLSRHILTTRRCYCILSRLPFFELHFGVLNSIFSQERLERLTKGVADISLEYSESQNKGEICLSEKSDGGSLKHCNADNDPQEEVSATLELNQGRPSLETSNDYGNHVESVKDKEESDSPKGLDSDADAQSDAAKEEVVVKHILRATNPENCVVYADDSQTTKQPIEKRFPNAVLPLLRFYHYESSDSSSSFQGSSIDDRNCRSDLDDTETEEVSVSGQEDTSDHNDILEWAKANSYGLLQIISEYYRIHCPARGSTIDLKSCCTSLEVAEARNALLIEEEASSLSIWTVACICGTLRLEHVLTMFAAALLEKQIVVVCSNLGILSAIVLSIIPLIRPYQWQSLLMPVLPNDMSEFLDAPVPYVVGVKNKTSEVQSKLMNVILVDANKNQVKSSTIPQLPKHKELLSSLSPFHAKLVGESFLGRKRPVCECTEVQVEAAKGFLAVLRSYLDSLCSNLRSHTITNVQSNDDKVSLLLKESFIDSFPSRDRPFMKHFVDTQLFSVHTDLVLSFFQKE